jgi:hypothetical protein
MAVHRYWRSRDENVKHLLHSSTTSGLSPPELFLGRGIWPVLAIANSLCIAACRVVKLAQACHRLV